MKREDKQSSFRIAVFILVVLLLLVSTALAGLIIMKHMREENHAPVVVPDNVITGSVSEAEPKSEIQMKRMIFPGMLTAAPIVVEEAGNDTITLKLYRNHATDSVPFRVENMFPGDREERSYTVQVSYKGRVSVKFHADIRAGYEKLAEVLKCRVTLNEGNALYEGLMRDMPSELEHTLAESSGGVVELAYKIEVYLDTSVGNEYQKRELLADFRWWVETEKAPSESGGEKEDGSKTDKTDGVQTGGELLPTGDSSLLWLWGTLLVCACAAAAALICMRKHKKEDRTDE